MKITHERLEQVEGYFDRHGGKTILIGRFIGLVRALAPFIAGSSGLPYRRFIPYSIVGTGLWSTTFCVLGYIFWRSFDRVAAHRRPGDLRLRRHGGVDRGIVVAYRRRGEIRGWFVEHDAIRSIRPLFASAAAVPVARAAGRAPPGPYVRFTGGRVMPGTLGLELTTLLATGGVGPVLLRVYLTELHRASRRPRSTARSSTSWTS